MATSISIQSLALFSISKSLSNKSTIGVLLGTKSDSAIEVHITFELVTSGSLIDLDFYNKRLQQYLTVSPEYEKLGIYKISGSTEPDESTIELASMVNSSVLLMVSDNIGALSSPSFIKGFYNSQPITTIIQSEEIENITLATIIKYNKYYNNQGHKQTNFFSANDSKKNLLSSVDQLLKKVEQIVQYCDSNHGVIEVHKCVELNNMIGQLVRKLQNLKTSDAPASDETDRLLSNELALLTKKFSLLDKYRNQANSNMAMISLPHRGLSLV